MRQASISSPPTTNAQNSARHLAPEDIEPTSHVWTEGASIGEATNPGPTQSHRTTGNQALQNGAGTASFHHCIRHGMVDGLGLNEAGCLCWHRFGVSDPGAPASGRTSPTKRQGHPRRSHDMVDGLNPNEAGCLCKHRFGAINRSGPGALTSGRSSPTKSQGHLLLPLPHPWPPCPIIIQATPRPGPVVDLCQDGDIHPNPGPPKRRPNDTFQSTNASQNHRPSATSQHRHRQEPSGSRMPRDWTSHCKMLSELYGAWMASTAPRNPNTMKSNSAGMPGNDGPFAVEDLHPVWPAGSQPRSQQPSRGGPSGVRTDRQCGVDRHAVNRQTSSRPMGRGSQEASNKPAERGTTEQEWRTAPQPTLDRAMAQLQSMQEQLRKIQGALSSVSQSTTPTVKPMRDDNMWAPLQPRRNHPTAQQRRATRPQSPQRQPNPLAEALEWLDSMLRSSPTLHRGNPIAPSSIGLTPPSRKDQGNGGGGGGRHPHQQPSRAPSRGYVPRSGRGPACLPGGGSQQGQAPGRAASQPSRSAWSGRVPAPKPEAPPGLPSQDRGAQRHRQQPQQQQQRQQRAPSANGGDGGGGGTSSSK